MERNHLEATPTEAPICTVKDIDPATRELLTRLFGRELPAEQKVMFTLLDVGTAPAEARRKAWATINRILDKAAANLENVPEPEFEAAVEEAMDHVRPRRTP